MEYSRVHLLAEAAQAEPLELAILLSELEELESEVRQMWYQMESVRLDLLFQLIEIHSEEHQVLQQGVKVSHRHYPRLLER